MQFKSIVAAATIKFTVGGLLRHIVIAVIFSGILISLVELSRYWMDTIPLIAYGLVFGFIILMVYGFLTQKEKKIIKTFKKEGGEVEVALLIVGIVVSSVVFGLFCRELYFSAGADFARTDNSNRLIWIGFDFDNLLEAIFFDIPSIYDLHISRITPDSFWTGTLVLVYRFIVDFILIAAAIRHWNILRSIVLRKKH